MRCQSFCCVNTLFPCYGKYIKETVIDLEMACVVTRTWNMWSYSRRRNLFSCCSPTPFHLCLQLGTQRQKLKGVEFCLIFLFHIYFFSPFWKMLQGIPVKGSRGDWRHWNTFRKCLWGESLSLLETGLNHNTISVFPQILTQLPLSTLDPRNSNCLSSAFSRRTDVCSSLICEHCPVLHGHQPPQPINLG